MNLLTHCLEMEEVLDYRNLSDRLQSFDSWPLSSEVSTTKLAEAGFFYTNFGDIVECPYCHIEGHQWNPEDDPRFDHASWSPTCPFIINGGDTRIEQQPWDIIENRSESRNDVSPLELILQQEPRNENPVIVCSSEVAHPIQEKDLCKICYSNIIEVLVVPCGHLVFCLQCSPSLDKCPLCRQVIWNKVRAYLP